MAGKDKKYETGKMDKNMSKNMPTKEMKKGMKGSKKKK